MVFDAELAKPEAQLPSFPQVIFEHQLGSARYRLICTGDKSSPTAFLGLEAFEHNDVDMLGNKRWRKVPMDAAAHVICLELYNRTPPFEGFSRASYDGLVRELEQAKAAEVRLQRRVDALEGELRGPVGPPARSVMGPYR